MHAALERLYRERPGGDPLPRPGIARRLDRARPRAGRRESPPSASSASHPAERAMRAAGRAAARALPRRGGRARRPAASSPGCSRPRFGEHEDAERPALELDGWGLHGAIDRVDRAADGRAARHRLQALGAGHPAREVRGGGEAAAAALPDRGRRALGRRAGRRPLPPAARDLGAAPARASSSSEAAGDLAGYGLYRTDVVDAEELEELLDDARRRAGEIVARMRARRHPPRPRAAAGPARPRRLPRLLHLRADLPPRPGARSSRGRRGRGARSGERRARADRPSRRRRSRPRGRDVLLEAGAGTGKTGVMVDRYCRLVCDERRLARRDPRLHLHRQGRGRAAPADPGRARRGGPRRGSERAGELLGGHRRRLGHDDPRLLQPAARRPPGRRRDRPALPRPRRAGGRAGRPRGLRRGARASSSPAATASREETVAAYDIDGLRAMVLGAHAELRSRGDRRARSCPSRRQPDPEAALRARGRGRRRARWRS